MGILCSKSREVKEEQRYYPEDQKRRDKEGKMLEISGEPDPPQDLDVGFLQEVQIKSANK